MNLREVIRCPACKVTAPLDSVTFETLGISPAGELAVRCLQCGAGLRGRLGLFGRLRISKVDAETWAIAEENFRRQREAE